MSRQQAVIGISDYAQDALSDIVYVELPSAGDTFRGQQAVRRRRVGQRQLRTFSLPVDGEVVAVNDSAIDAPRIAQQRSL